MPKPEQLTYKDVVKWLRQTSKRFQDLADQIESVMTEVPLSGIKVEPPQVIPLANKKTLNDYIREKETQKTDEQKIKELPH